MFGSSSSISMNLHTLFRCHKPQGFRHFSRCSTPVLAKWTKDIQQDFYFKEAKRFGYVSRAAYKLKEIQQKHKVIKQGGRVLDLGCTPGAWLQIACQELGPRTAGGLVLGVDIQEVPELPLKFCDDRVRAIRQDARLLGPPLLDQYAPGGFDTILSDMLHSTSGVNDVELSLDLAGAALNIATGYQFALYGDALATTLGFRHDGLLRPGGALVMKVYDGAGVHEFILEMRKHFTKVVRMHADASRSMSREFYAIGLGRKTQGQPQQKQQQKPHQQQQQQQQQPQVILL